MFIHACSYQRYFTPHNTPNPNSTVLGPPTVRISNKGAPNGWFTHLMSEILRNSLTVTRTELQRMNEMRLGICDCHACVDNNQIFLTVLGVVTESCTIRSAVTYRPIIAYYRTSSRNTLPAHVDETGNENNDASDTQ